MCLLYIQYLACGLPIAGMVRLIQPLSLHEVSLHLRYQLRLQFSDSILQTTNLVVSALHVLTILLQLLFVGGQLQSFGFQLVPVVFKHLLHNNVGGGSVRCVRRKVVGREGGGGT